MAFCGVSCGGASATQRRPTSLGILTRENDTNPTGLWEPVRPLDSGFTSAVRRRGHEQAVYGTLTARAPSVHFVIQNRLILLWHLFMSKLHVGPHIFTMVASCTGGKHTFSLWTIYLHQLFPLEPVLPPAVQLIHRTHHLA
jgi:hypothetical protein